MRSQGGDAWKQPFALGLEQPSGEPLPHGAGGPTLRHRAVAVNETANGRNCHSCKTKTGRRRKTIDNSSFSSQAPMRAAPLSALALPAITLLTLTHAGSASALTTICTAAWTLPYGTPGGTKSALIQGSNPACPTSAITATVDVGTGLNAGALNPSGATWNTDAGTNLFPPTSDSGIAIGSPAATATNLRLTFDVPVVNPYFYASYFNAGESLTFTDPFSLLQSNAVSKTGLTVTGSGPDSSRHSSFVARFQGRYSAINFNYANSNSQAVSFAITTGVTPVPGPLPLLGVGAALSQSRKLRRRIQGRC